MLHKAFYSTIQRKAKRKKKKKERNGRLWCMYKGGKTDVRRTVFKFSGAFYAASVEEMEKKCF